MYCNNCGRIIPDSSRFCSFCGCPLNNQPPIQPSQIPPSHIQPYQNRPSQKKKKLLLIALSVTLALLLLITLAVFMLNSFSSRQEAANPLYEPCTIIVSNEKGDKLREENYNKYGDKEEIINYADPNMPENIHKVMRKYKYDNNNRKTRQEIWFDDKLSSYEIFNYEGQTRTGKYYDINDELKSTSKATLNEMGFPTEIKEYDSDGELSFKEHNTYDEYGNIVKSESYSSDSDPYQRVQSADYTYKNGKPVKATVKIDLTHTKGGKSVTSIEKWEYVYNSTPESTTETAMEDKTEAKELSEKEQAYAFLEESSKLLEDNDYASFADRYSEKVLSSLGSSRIDLESLLRQKDLNYNNRDFNIISYFKSSGSDDPYWGIVLGAHSTVNGDDTYGEEQMITFKENGEWVISSMQDYKNYKQFTGN